MLRTSRQNYVLPLILSFLVSLTLLLAMPWVGFAEEPEGTETAPTSLGLEPWDGQGTAADPYLVRTAENLTTLASRVNAGNSYESSYFQLTSDIELSGSWMPIGTATNPFKGSFDGGGYAVRGLSIDIEQASTVYAGLFGYVDVGTTGASSLKNLTVEGSIRAVSTLSSDDDYGDVYAGLVVGFAGKNTSMMQVSAIGSGIDARALGEWGTVNAGGVAGRCGAMDAASSIQNGALSGRCAGGTSFVGGLAGYAMRDVVGSSAVVSSIGSAESVSSALGGLLGCTSASVRSSMVQVLGNIEGNAIDSSCAVGGLVGISSNFGGAVMENSTALTGGSISAVSVGGDALAGGVLGWDMQEMKLASTVAKVTGDVLASTESGQAFAGGLAGYTAVVDASGSLVQGSVRAKSASNAHAGGLAGLAGKMLDAASWVEGSVVAKGGDEAVTGGSAGVLLGSLENTSGSVSGDVSVAAGTGNACAGGLVGRTMRGAGLRNALAHVEGDVVASGDAGRYAGGIVGNLHKKSGTNSNLVAETKGVVDVGPVAGGYAGGIEGYVEGNDSGYLFVNSVALVGQLNGGSVWRIGGAETLYRDGPFGANYAAASTLVNGAVVPDGDPDKTADLRHGADWPAAGTSWQSVLVNDAAWVFPPADATPYLKSMQTVADKIDAVLPVYYLVTIDPSITNGTVASVPSGLARAGDQVKVSVVPDEGYRLVDGSLGYATTVGSFQSVADGVFVMPEYNVVLTATFEAAVQPGPAPSEDPIPNQEPTPIPLRTTASPGGKVLASTGDSAGAVGASAIGVLGGVAVLSLTLARHRRCRRRTEERRFFSE